MGNKPRFKPTPEQINAAQMLFIAMAFQQMVKPVFEQMEKDLLASGEFHYDEQYYSEKWKSRGFEYPEDRIIRDVKDAYQMRGLMELTNYKEPLMPEEIKKLDAAIYFKKFREVALAAGFKNGENTACMADNEVIKLESRLIEVTKNIHSLDLDEIVMLEHRKKLIDLLLGLFAPLAKGPELEKNKRQYFDERINEKEVTHG